MFTNNFEMKPKVETTNGEMEQILKCDAASEYHISHQQSCSVKDSESKARTYVHIYIQTTK